MKIVYGVSGEGMGHVYEALEIAALLRDDGHEVKMLTYGARACAALAAHGPLRIEGLPLYFGPRGLSLAKTLVRNWRLPGFYLRNGRRLKAEVAAIRPDVFLTAFEPFTTHLAHALKKPLISMDNQNELLHLPKPVGADAMAYRMARWATRLCTHGAAYYLVKSFRKPAVADPRVRFVSPIVQEEIRNLEAVPGRHVLVYLTKPNPRLIELLRSVNEMFLVHGQQSGKSDGNVLFRSSGPDYLRDLGGCKAVLGTTGFSLIADAIFLKKPYFGVPLKKQFEQTNNAHFLRSAGLGEFAEEPSRHDLRCFFASLDRYRSALARFRFNAGEQGETLRAVLDEIDRERAGASVRLTAFAG